MRRIKDSSCSSSLVPTKEEEREKNECLEKEWRDFIMHWKFCELNPMHESSFLSSHNEKVPFSFVKWTVPLPLLYLPESPEPSGLRVSTKTLITHVNKTFPLIETFWSVPVLTSYARAEEGIVMKLFKFKSSNVEDLNGILYQLDRLEQENPDGLVRVKIILTTTASHRKFKDIRRIQVGVCKKDLMPNKQKNTSAFQNCIVFIVRIRHVSEGCPFHEYHVKVFNTGKIEIPGIQDHVSFQSIMRVLFAAFSRLHPDHVFTYEDSMDQPVLINSNFNCGFYLNRDRLQDVLVHKYGLPSLFDPNSYQAVKCTYRYSFDRFYATQVGYLSLSEVELMEDKTSVNMLSFMIFRTGSVIISGRCNDSILNEIYQFVSTLLRNEWLDIRQPVDITVPMVKVVHRKRRRSVLKLK